MQKAIIYCRVSTEEQAEHGYSLDAQEKFCRSFALNNAYRIGGVFRDEGKSGTTLDRPALKDLLVKCQEDKSITAVIVQETDRLARNTQGHLTIKTLLQKSGVKLVSVAQPMLDDSPEGKMIDTIIASVNQFQSDINSRKTKKGLQQKFDEGWWPSWAPLGYVNVAIGGNPDGRMARKIVKKDPDRWHLVNEGFKLYLTGTYSVDHINDILHKKGLRSRTGKKIPHSVMVNILKNPFYAGLMRWDGKEKMGKHPAMITLAEHKLVLNIMNSHNNFACRRRRHNFLLRGFIICNICGQKYVGEKHPHKNKEYYHCGSMRKHSNQGQNVEVAVLEKQIEEQFKIIQFSDAVIELVLVKLRHFYSQQHEVIASKIQTLYNQKKAIEAKRNTAEQKLLNGVLGDDDFTRLRTKFKADLDSIQNQIDEISSQKEFDIDVITEVIKLSRDIYKVYKTVPYELKRGYLGLFWEKFLVQDKKIVAAVPTKLIAALQQGQKVRLSPNWLPSPLLNLTLRDWQYMSMLKERLNEIKILSKVS
jgi:site-specific DNA recombinase